MESFLSRAPTAVGSLVGSLIARCLALRIKSNASRGETILRSLNATLGIMAEKYTISIVLRTLVECIVANLDLESLTLVWLNAPTEGIESIAMNKAMFVADDGSRRLDALVDISSSLTWGSVAEVQATLAKWMKRMDPGAPILMTMPRYSRIMAHIETPNALVRACMKPPDVLVEATGMDWSIEFPYSVVHSWTRTFIPLTQIVTRATISFSERKRIEGKQQQGLRKITTSMIPFRAIEMVASQSKIECVMNHELDKAALLMSTKSLSATRDQESLLSEWQQSLALLGMLSVSVWVHDPADECAGIWRAALDGWRHGNSVWPV